MCALSNPPCFAAQVHTLAIAGAHVLVVLEQPEQRSLDVVSLHTARRPTAAELQHCFMTPAAPGKPLAQFRIRRSVEGGAILAITAGIDFAQSFHEVDTFALHALGLV